jgi:zinc transporter 7
MVSSTAFSAALVSTALISLAPNLILLLFPQYATREALQNSSFLSLGQAVAAGGLMGDVFLHTLSHAVDYEEEKVGLWFLSGFAVFFVMDVVIRSLGGGHSHTHATSENGTHHHGAEQKSKINGSSSPVDHSLPESLLTSSVILNLTGDSLHNFTDGLAIGASFATAHAVEDRGMLSLLTSRGGLAAVSILFHEIPHELGDYCILLKGGFSKSQAILAQFMTAIAAFIGTLLGLWAVEGWWGGEKLVYATAGGFVYLAAVNILPDLLDEHASLRLRLAQVCAFGVGIAFMQAVSLLEEEDEHSHHHHHHHHHVEDDSHRGHSHHSDHHEL